MRAGKENETVMDIDVEALLGALARARGRGLSLKDLEQQLTTGAGGRQKLRRGLKQLMREGRAATDGHYYRATPADAPAEPPSAQVKRETQAAQASARKPARTQRPGPAALQEGSRLRQEWQEEKAARPAGASAWGEQRQAAKPRAAPKTKGELVGPLHLKSEGYGFVAPLLGGPRGEDVFVPPGRTGKALDGDVVKVRLSKGRDGRTIGEVIEIVEHRRQMALGAYRVRGPRAVVEPHDRRMSEAIEVAKDSRFEDGALVKVRLERDADGDLRGRVLAALGPRGEARFEILSAAYAQGFSDEFDRAVLLAAEGIPDHVLPEDKAGRRDLRALPLVTIDGEDARDFDDAVHVSRSGTGYRLVVAIADVAHYVQPGGALDREALHRATSVYFPGTVLPMLPERLSNGICSLNPDVERLCMVCDLALDGSGNPQHADLYPSVMRSHGRLTYTQVAEALQGKCPPELLPLLPDLLVAGELAKKLTGLRRERGSIDFDLAEPKIVLREDGTVAEIVSRPRNDAHRLVEEFMLAANEGVARFFSARNLPTLYRIHDQPDAEKLETFGALAATHGFKLPEKLTPKALNSFLEEIKDTPAQKALNSLLLRAMMQAQYSPDDIGHYGLAAPTYLHFTSPIRRYPDLMVHRLLHQFWGRGGGALPESQREEEEAYLAGVAAQCSERERASMKAERDVDSFYAAVYMQDHVGEEFDAVIAGVADLGLFCELDSPAVEGLVPAETLGDGVELDAALHRLVVGRSGRSFGVGDPVRVLVEASDPVRRRITLALVSATDLKADRTAGKGKREHEAQARPKQHVWAKAQIPQDDAPGLSKRPAGKGAPARSGRAPLPPARGDGWLRPDDFDPNARPAPRALPSKGQASRPAAPGKPRPSSPAGRPPRRGGKPGRGR